MKLDPKKQDSERGFALLIVFLMAAAVAFAFYAQMPRVAFESAREREQLLMDRGNEYKRAIQVFYAVNKRYPAKLEDLENTNDKRYLRRRYKDPLTGKDEWRLVHTNGSVLTDSLTEKPPTQNGKNALPGGGPLGTNNLNSAAAGSGGTGATDPNNPTNNPNGGPAQVNAAVAARPSDRVFTPDQVQPQLGRGGFPQGGFPQGGLPQGGFPPAGFNGQQQGNALAGIQSNIPGQAAYDPSDPRTWPAITTLTPQNGQGQNGQQQNGVPANPGFPNPALQNPALQNQNQPFSSQPFQSQPQISTPGIPGQAGGPGGLNPQTLNLGGFQQAPGGNVTGPPANAVTFPAVDNSSAALGLINNQLTQPNPTFNPASNQTPNQNPNAFPNTPFSAAPGAGGATNTTNGTSNGTNTNTNINPGNAAPGANTNGGGGPGIAGVASKHEGPSIKSYHEHTKYQEWEFVYKPQQGVGGTPPGTTNPQLPGGQQGQQGQPGGANPQNPANPSTFGPSSFPPIGGASNTQNPAVPAQGQ